MVKRAYSGCATCSPALCRAGERGVWNCRAQFLPYRQRASHLARARLQIHKRLTELVIVVALHYHNVREVLDKALRHAHLRAEVPAARAERLCSVKVGIATAVHHFYDASAQRFRVHGLRLAHAGQQRRTMG